VKKPGKLTKANMFDEEQAMAAYSLQKLDQAVEVTDSAKA